MLRNLTDNFILMVFQPDESFYHLSFEDRLTNLTKKIEIAQTYFRRNGFMKGIFVAPEYLFKDLNKEGENRYFNHDQKLKFIETLKALSDKQSRLILAPGTICWSKLSKESNEPHYRNELLFFYQGQVQKYKKAFPHKDFDYDFLKDKNLLNFFKTGINDPALIDIGGLRIAVEICFDHQNQRVQNLLNTEEKFTPIDIHLIVADRLTNVTPLKRHGVLTIKVEKNPDPRSLVKNIIGTNLLDEKDNVQIVDAGMTATLDTNIKCYQFTHAPELKATSKINPEKKS